MIQINLSSDQDQIEIGQEITVSAMGDNPPFIIQISCFVEDPPPPGFKGCAECNVYEVESNELIKLTADQNFWWNHRGSYRIKIRDSVGDTEEVRIPVISEGFGFSDSNFETITL